MCIINLRLQSAASETLSQGGFDFRKIRLQVSRFAPAKAANCQARRANSPRRWKPMLFAAFESCRRCFGRSLGNQDGQAGDGGVGETVTCKT